VLIDHPEGEYVPLVWDQDGEAPAHYVSGHVTDAEFRAEIDRWFEGSRRKPTIPPDAKIEHVYVRKVRVGNDEYGNRAYEVRHCAATDHGARPRTYLEIEPWGDGC
jgi:hypothetical protein